MPDVRKLIAATILENAYDEDDGEDWLFLADAILDALRDAKLVVMPTSPTREMIDAVFNQKSPVPNSMQHDVGGDGCRLIYRVMMKAYTNAK